MFKLHYKERLKGEPEDYEDRQNYRMEELIFYTREEALKALNTIGKGHITEFTINR